MKGGGDHGPDRAGDGAEHSFRQELAERLWEKYHRFVYSFFMHRGFTLEECRDLTQDVYLRVVQGMGGLRSEAAAPGWIRQIVSNVWKNELRHRKAALRGAPESSLDTMMETEEPIPKEVLPGASSRPKNPFEETAHRETMRHIRQVWKELPPQPRRCLGLYVQGLSYQEIGNLLRISVQTVKPHIHRARKRLKEKLPTRRESHDD